MPVLLDTSMRSFRKYLCAPSLNNENNERKKKKNEEKNNADGWVDNTQYSYDLGRISMTPFDLFYYVTSAVVENHNIVLLVISIVPLLISISRIDRDR